MFIFMLTQKAAFSIEISITLWWVSNSWSDENTTWCSGTTRGTDIYHRYCKYWSEMQAQFLICLPWRLWKQEHHSLLEMSWSRPRSHDLRKAFVHASSFSEPRPASSDCSRWRSEFLSSLVNIQPREPLQMGILVTSAAAHQNRKSEWEREMYKPLNVWSLQRKHV